jgi:hypothetical protein
VLWIRIRILIWIEFEFTEFNGSLDPEGKITQKNKIKQVKISFFEGLKVLF